MHPELRRLTGRGSAIPQRVSRLLPDADPLATHVVGADGNIVKIAPGDAIINGQTIYKHTEDAMHTPDRKTIIKHQMEQLQAEMYELEQFGEDKYEDGTILVFEMQFGPNEETYAYAALKKVDKWFLTGNVGGQYWTWEKLVNFWKDKVIRIAKVETFEEVFAREGLNVVKAGALEGDVIDKDVDVQRRDVMEQSPEGKY